MRGLLVGGEVPLSLLVASSGVLRLNQGPHSARHFCPYDTVVARMVRLWSKYVLLARYCCVVLLRALAASSTPSG